MPSLTRYHSTEKLQEYLAKTEEHINSLEKEGILIVLAESLQKVLDCNLETALLCFLVASSYNKKIRPVAALNCPHCDGYTQLNGDNIRELLDNGNKIKKEACQWCKQEIPEDVEFKISFALSKNMQNLRDKMSV